ncbi:3-oxoacyl-ACP reductase FabG [Beggiatoa leptomitoformis]|uniref:3-oxoacyl-[acyl-carrier-protein] reductase n=1 Tax=Beggiatoa leptomitoformis TaxID=288004 RepID=A0A2N9YEF1_9GAMM|nr:3-oxoacyl-ACP reductase FabG [Beggiatoa leptomitoformis]ALG68772.1 3-oxoacyl-ACP reductase FabG [Beggiatoa leptomitoformis]AUI68867.1 3-oxoacyl-ACP reductase FabG [Beggiatoa leptomitoformis]
MAALTGEIALVTGASRGIGKAIALTLGQAGAQIIGTATSAEGAASIEQYLTEQGIIGKGMVLDVGSADSINTLMDALAKTMPSILVNNAAITRDALLMRMDDADWDGVINTNLTSVYRLAKACIRSMLKAKRGRIITLTSVVGLTGNAGQANYSAAKAGVIGFTKSLAKEVGSRGITVNAVAPGFIETDMTRKLTDEQRNFLIQQIPLARMGSVEDIAAAVAFLASPSAAYITGETLHVNGGMYMA